jgi:DNA-binding CsgD family transcriptional regulator
LVSDTETFDLIDQIYDAALEGESAWRDLLIALEHQFPGGRAILALQDLHASRVDLFLAPHYDACAIRSYGAYYASINPWMAAFARGFQGSIHSGEMLVRERIMVASEFYSDWLKPQGLHCGGGCTILKDASRVMVFSVLKPRGIESVTEEEFQLMRKLVPHLQRAAQLRRQFGDIEQKAKWATDVLNGLAAGAIILRPPRNIALMNRSAKDILARTQLLTIDATGALRARGVSEDAQFTKLISTALDTAAHKGFSGGGAMTVVGDDDEPPLSVLVSPVAPSTGLFNNCGAPAALLFIAIQGHEPALRSEILTSLYGLTRAEALVLSKLVRGMSLRDIASSHHVSLNTIRNQTQRVMEKTNTSRQADLVAKVLTAVGGLL